MAGTQNLTLCPLCGIEEPESLITIAGGIVLAQLRVRQLWAKLSQKHLQGPLGSLQDAD